MSDTCPHGTPKGSVCYLCNWPKMTAQHLAISPEHRLLLDVKHLDRIAGALEKIQGYLERMVHPIMQTAVIGGPANADAVDTRCVGHVEGPVTDHHGDGQPIYGPGYRCNATGTPCDDGLYRCEEHKKIRARYQKWTATGGRR
jgi:hypothetical protein